METISKKYGKNQNGKYVPTEKRNFILDPAARRLAFVYHQLIWIVKEYAQLQDYDEPEYGLINPYKGPFLFIETAFNASVISPRTLIDKLTLSVDDCAAIAEAIRNAKNNVI